MTGLSGHVTGCVWGCACPSIEDLHTYSTRARNHRHILSCLISWFYPGKAKAVCITCVLFARLADIGHGSHLVWFRAAACVKRRANVWLTQCCVHSPRLSLLLGDPQIPPNCTGCLLVKPQRLVFLFLCVLQNSREPLGWLPKVK